MSAARSLETVVTSIGVQGDGVTADRTYVPMSLPGELVRISVQGGETTLEEILTPSPDRVVPPCAHFGTCGGCVLQHWGLAPYLAWKREQIEQLLARERIETMVLPAVAIGPGSRRRLALHARGGKGGSRLGFKARRSWSLVEIDMCEIADPQLVAQFGALRALSRPLLEHPKSAPTLHVTLTQTGLDLDITGVERRSGGLSADARVKVAGLAAQADLARVTLAGEVIYQARQPVVVLGRASVGLPPGAFLQASVQAEQAMAAFVLEGIQGAHHVADLYAGVGTFSFRLAEVAQVRALELSPEAVLAMRKAIATAPGLKSIEAEARDLVRRPLLSTEMKKLDAVVLDPPRSGAEGQCQEIAKSVIGRVVYVSCNPATFTRDAAILVQAGFVLERVLPVDQFLWSPHIELVGIFSR